MLRVRRFYFLPIIRSICIKRTVTRSINLVEERRTNLNWVLSEVYLGNPLVCDCEMRWYKKWFNAEWQVTRAKLYTGSPIYCVRFYIKHSMNSRHNIWDTQTLLAVTGIIFLYVRWNHGSIKEPWVKYVIKSL